MESLKSFVEERLSKDVGCYYHTISDSTEYTLKKYDSHGKHTMRCIGWVVEITNIFEILVEKKFIDSAGLDLSKAKPRIEPKRAFGRPCYIFECEKGSIAEDYKKVVSLLKVVLSRR